MRFLRARDFNVDKAEDMVLAIIKWRLEFKPHNISSKDIEHHFKQGKNYFYGYDKLKRPIIVMRVRLDTPDDVPGKLKIMVKKSYFLIKVLCLDLSIRKGN